MNPTQFSHNAFPNKCPPQCISTKDSPSTHFKSKTSINSTNSITGVSTASKENQSLFGKRDKAGRDDKNNKQGRSNSNNNNNSYHDSHQLEGFLYRLSLLIRFFNASTRGRIVNLSPKLLLQQLDLYVFLAELIHLVVIHRVNLSKQNDTDTYHLEIMHLHLRSEKHF